MNKTSYRWLIAVRYLVSTLLALSFCAACSGGPRDPSLLLSPGGFPAPNRDFQLYRQQVSEYVNTRSLPARSERAITLNLPFEINASEDVPYRGRFLLMHGLNDSAYVWHDMAHAIAKRGFDVRAILLPGHGSHPREMLAITWQSWLATAQEHVNLWSTDDTPLYLGGFSMGAVLATIIALEQPDLAGLFLVSPAFHSRLNYLLRWSAIYKKIQPWMFGGMILEDNPIKYNSIPINSGDQYFRLTRVLKKRWKRSTLDIPLLAVMTSDDSVVNVDAVRSDIYRRFKHPDNRVILYSNQPPARLYPAETVRPSAYPDLRILNQSHLGMINAQSNPLFGRNGRILVCNGNVPSVFFGCMRATGHWYGAQHTPAPDNAAVARTTYNPDIEFVLSQFDELFLVSKP